MRFCVQPHLKILKCAKLAFFFRFNVLRFLTKLEWHVRPLVMQSLGPGNYTKRCKPHPSVLPLKTKTPVEKSEKVQSNLGSLRSVLRWSTGTVDQVLSPHTGSFLLYITS